MNQNRFVIEGTTAVKLDLIAICFAIQGLWSERLPPSRAEQNGRPGPPMLCEFRRGPSSGTGHDEALAKSGGPSLPRMRELTVGRDCQARLHAYD